MHGHSVGGTNPSLLRAMGAGANVIAWDVNFNREVLGDSGRYFADASQLTKLIEETEADPVSGRENGVKTRYRAADAYRWDDVAAGYDRLCAELRSGVRARRLRRPYLGRSASARTPEPLHRA